MVGLTSPVCPVKAFGTGPQDDEGYLRVEIWFDPEYCGCPDEKFSEAADTISLNSGGKYHLDLTDTVIGKITVLRNPMVTRKKDYKLDSAVNLVTRLVTESAWY